MKGVVNSLDGEFVYTKNEVSDNNESGSDSNDDDKIIDSRCIMLLDVTHSTFYSERLRLKTNIEINKGLDVYES